MVDSVVLDSNEDEIIDYVDPNLAFKTLAEKAATYLEEKDIQQLRKSFEFADAAHHGQKRKTGAPYITHPLAVAIILTDLKVDASSLVAAVLHDTVEDTDVSLEDITEHFSKEISDLVDGLTKISKIRFQSKQEKLAENFRKMILAMAKDLRVIMVKLGDRLHNMRTLENLREEKRLRIAQETLDIYAPLAGRLGMYGIKSELEDLCFRQLKNDVYRDISTRVAARRSERKSSIQEMLGTLQGELQKYGFEKFEVYGRPKHFYSIYKKMHDKRVEFDSILDLFAYRIQVHSIKECYEVLGLVHSLWKPMPGRFKDYIAMPKPNLYQSLHTTVLKPNGDPAEIQIRTFDMHSVCELGIAAHWSYKETGREGQKKEDLKKFSWLRQILEWQSELKDPDEFLEAVKVDLFDEEIFVFTPNGDVIALPKKASCLDFAFAVHTELGLKTAGAKVNGRMQPLKHLLRSGDVVEIIRNKNQNPNKDWLQYVYSSKARNKLRAFLRTEQRDRARKLGEQLLAESCGLIGINPETLRAGKSHDAMMKAAHENNFDDLTLAIGYGKIQPQNILKKVFPKKFSHLDDAPINQEKPSTSQGKNISKRGSIAVNGMDNILVRMARCCQPLAGESIIGFVTRGRGVSVHRNSCSRALDLDPERRIPVSWRDMEQTEVFQSVYLRIFCQDRPGLLSETTGAIAALGANILRADIQPGDGVQAKMDFEVSIRNHKQLMVLIQKLEMISGVVAVKRTSAYHQKKGLGET